MKKLVHTSIAAVGAVFAVTESAWAGIPIANWSLPYIIGSTVVMFALMGLTSLLKPSDVLFKDISSENSSPAAVIGSYISKAGGAVVMLFFSWGAFDGFRAII
jgi:hypothetical protein